MGNGKTMKTTIEMPDELYRRVKIEAARRGTKVKNLVEQGLRLVLEARRAPQQPPKLAARMKPARGTVDSGIVDLASNPDHLADFGRDALRHR
jgi:hypothetical protein